MRQRADRRRFDTATGRPVFPSPRDTVTLSSRGAWRGLLLEQTILPPRELDSTGSAHVVAVHLGRPSLVEASWPGRPRATFRQGPGTVDVVPAGMPLFVRWHEELEVLLLHIAPEILGATVDGTGARAGLEEGLAIEDRFIAPLVEALRDDVRAGHPAGRMYGETLAIALVVHLLKRQPAHRGGLGPARLRRVLDYIDANLHAHLSLEDLAVLVETSVFHFVRSFRESIGLPPHQYLLRRRVERAKQLLVDPRMSLVDVALRCGFASQSHLTAAFHRLARITPRDYRKGRPDGSSA